MHKVKQLLYAAMVYGLRRGGALAAPLVRVCVVGAGVAWITCQPAIAALEVAFEVADITPRVGAGKDVWLAGYGWGRAATGVHDPLFARTVVLRDGRSTIALVSVDLVGLQYPEVLRIREQLADVNYVLVSSTHNHEGPDTIGIWGRTPFQRGVDPQYLDLVVEQVVSSVRRGIGRLQPATARFGTAADSSLLGDSRLPVVKDGLLRLLRFDPVPAAPEPLGILVQWNCHPESLGSKNTEITADFCAATIRDLETRHQCPVAYFTGAVGGLMAPPDNLLKRPDGSFYREGEFDFAVAYGQAVAKLADQALADTAEVELCPFRVSAAQVALPVQNSLYRTARLVGVLRRKAVVWNGDFREIEEPQELKPGREFAVATEVACLQLGALRIAAIPGEIYPELVYGQFQDPVEADADFPDAPREPTIAQTLGSQPWLLFGLANDEVGYILPRSQWDLTPPFAYGRTKPQYGEINSCGPETAPIVMQAFVERVAELEKPAVEPLQKP